jgi:hypothetical protein
LRLLSRQWDEAFATVLSAHSDAVTARTVAMVVDGMSVTVPAWQTSTREWEDEV